MYRSFQPPTPDPKFQDWLALQRAVQLSPQASYTLFLLFSARVYQLPICCLTPVETQGGKPGD